MCAGLNWKIYLTALCLFLAALYWILECSICIGSASARAVVLFTKTIGFASLVISLKVFYDRNDFKIERRSRNNTVILNPYNKMCVTIYSRLIIVHSLGLCEVCDFSEAKYTCPKCEVKTCCLRCLNIHKKELDCNGIRDKTKFIPIRNMTKMDFMSDYTFLEECTRYVADRKRDPLKRFTRFNKNLPAPKFKLRCAAQDRRTTLRFLLGCFSKNTANSTFYDWKEKVKTWDGWNLIGNNGFCVLGNFLACRMGLSKCWQYHVLRWPLWWTPTSP